MASESLLNNETAWRAYTMVVRQIPVSGAIPSNQILYVCPPTRMGIGARDDVPTPAGNNQACDVCNGLVAAEDLIFGPSDNTGYFAGFQKYINAVIATPIPPSTSTHVGNVNEKRDTLCLCNSEEAERESRRVGQRDDKDVLYHRNLPSGTTFMAWCQQNAWSYLSAVRDTHIAEEAKYQADLVSQFKFLAACLNTGCTDQDLGELPAGDCFRPSYAIANYNETVEVWRRDYDRVSPQVWKFDLDQARQTESKEFGYDSAKTSSGGYCWFWSNKRNSSNRVIKESVEVEDITSNVKVELSIKSSGVFTINAGGCDVPGVSKLYPNTVPGLNVRGGLIKPVAILMAYGVNLKIKFDSSARKRVDTLVNTVSTRDGTGLSIFGFRCGGGFSSTSTRNTTSNRLDQICKEGQFEFSALNDGFPILLGVIGAKIQ